MNPFHLPRILGTLLLAGFVSSLSATPTQLGDVDDDGVFTANDLAKLVAHSAGTIHLSETLQPFADLNQDGVINSTDQEELVKLILESETPRNLPLAKVLKASPYDNEGDVSVTRETVIHFTMPLALNAALDTSNFYAEFGPRKILSRVEISSDRRKATLFYLEPLPSSARIRVIMVPDALNDLIGRGVDLDENDTPGGAYVFSFETLSITPVAGTAVIGRVLASEPGPGDTDVPLVGVTVTVDGAEETLRTVTDAQGNFTLSPCPAGSFFVHVDGRTATGSNYPNGNYYPSVGKRWDAFAGKLDNLCGNVEDPIRGTVYLPQILGGSLAAVSSIQETPVELPASVVMDNPELEGLRIEVPPNSLFADDGTRGGRVGMAVVDPDRLPSPLPPGLELPVVITIQTDGGTNFDSPVPMCFPNLPDPVTGETLPPGAKSALLSFNHDLGQWEVVGPMTVTEDGLFVKTDAGVGVRQPGWHGSGGGSGGGGGPGTGGGGEGEGGGEEKEKEKKKKPNCEETRSNWDLAVLIANNVKEAASCVAEGIRRIKNSLKCAITAIDLLKTVSVNYGKIMDAASKGDSLAIMEFYLGIVEAKLKDVKAAMECYKAASPINHYIAAFNCVGNALAVIDNLCQYFDKPGIPEECRPRESIRGFCVVVFTLREFHAQLKLALDLITAKEEQLALAFAQATVGEAKLILETIRRARAMSGGASAAPPPPDADIFLTNEERAMLMARLNKLGEDISGVKDYTASIVDSDKALNNLQKEADKMLKVAGDATAEMGVPVRRSYYYLLESGGFTRRGRTPNSGGFNFIMPPDERYELTVYDASSKSIGSTVGATGPNGSNFDINAIIFEPTEGMSDLDADGLVDAAEEIVGTSIADKDSDSDGLSDALEVEQGSNPLGNRIVQTGVIASSPASGMAIDVTASNNLSALAGGLEGVTLYNVSTGPNPVRIASIDTQGIAQAVALSADYMAVADGQAGLAIISLIDRGNPVLSQQVALGGGATSVATDGLTAFIGLDNGYVAVVDLVTGTILQSFDTGPGIIEDVALGREKLYVLKVGTLSTLNVDGATLSASSSIASPGSKGAGGRRLRLFVGDSYLWAFHTSGYNVFSLASPGTPTLSQPVTTAQFGWKQMVANGSGLGIAAVDPNSTSDGAHDISLYTTGADGLGTGFVGPLPTPGLAAAVTLYNGLAYIADSASGLQVMNYLAFDDLGLAPAITLDSNLTLNHTTHTGTVEEGRIVRVSASVTDDVQIRNVEFYLNGSLALVDGNFPFEHRFAAPALSATSTSMTFRAKATDTGGNVAWTEEYTITLTPDATPPAVTKVLPGEGAVVGRIGSLYAVFNEQIDPASLTASSMPLKSPGVDGVFDTPDDLNVTGIISYRENIRAAFMDFGSTGLTPGLYRLRVQAPLADLAGNLMIGAFNREFRVYNAGLDTDSDGVPDDAESHLGLDPANPDSNNNGTLDGQEDYDGDGLTNAAEFYVGSDPKAADTNGNGIPDGQEDQDGDGLKDQQEFALGTNPLKTDTDGDGWSDEVEVEGMGNPTNPAIQPRFYVHTGLGNALSVFKPSYDAPTASLGAITSPVNTVSVFKNHFGTGDTGTGRIGNSLQSLFIFKPAYGPGTSGTGFGGITTQPQVPVKVLVQP